MRGWDGIWETSFGRLRLVAEGARIQGLYECGGPSSLEGTAGNDALDFEYREPAVFGSGQSPMA